MTVSSAWPSWMLLLMLSVMLCARTSRAGFERTCSRDRQTPEGMCGNNLSMILSTVCRMYNKRGSPSDARSTSGTRSEESSSYLKTDIFLPKHEALSVLKRSRRATGTITCECCVHRCSINELRQYCSEVREDEPLKRKSEPVPVLTTEEPFVTTAAADDAQDDDDDDDHDADEAKDIDHDTFKKPINDNKLERELLEDLHRVQKRRIGQEMLRSAPSWWQSLNEMAAKYTRAQGNGVARGAGQPEEGRSA